MTYTTENCYFKITVFEALLIIPNEITVDTSTQTAYFTLCLYSSLNSETCNPATLQHSHSARLNESSHKYVLIN